MIINLEEGYSYVLNDEFDSSMLPAFTFNQELVFLDTETTGLNLNQDDELLEIGVIDYDGKVLFNELVKPAFKTSWLNAEKINNISPLDVLHAKTLYELKDELIGILKNKTILCYNAAFDSQFFKKELFQDLEFACVQEIVSCYIKRDNGRFISLQRLAQFLEVKTDDIQHHRALSDAELCRRVYRAFCEKFK